MSSFTNFTNADNVDVFLPEDNMEWSTDWASPGTRLHRSSAPATSLGQWQQSRCSACTYDDDLVFCETSQTPSLNMCNAGVLFSHATSPGYMANKSRAHPLQRWREVDAAVAELSPLLLGDFADVPRLQRCIDRWGATERIDLVGIKSPRSSGQSGVCPWYTYNEDGNILAHTSRISLDQPHSKSKRCRSTNSFPSTPTNPSCGSSCVYGSMSEPPIKMRSLSSDTDGQPVSTKHAVEKSG